MGLYCCLESTHSTSRKEVLSRTAGHIGCREGVRKSQVSGDQWRRKTEERQKEQRSDLNYSDDSFIGL